MKVTWTLIPLLLGSSVVSVLCAAEECETSNVEHCYNTLVHYEGLGFPLYGKDQEELNETCETMSDSFDCIQAYWQQCNKSGACDDDEDCTQMLEDIETFSLNTGLRNVEKELCNDGAIREAYLENYSCLAGNSDHYAACHNDSQLSQEYMTKITEPSQVITSRCCFFTWYHDCFTNITRDNCNENATFFVSIVLHNLIAHISDQVCGKSPDVCDSPPLPTPPTDPFDPIENITDVDNALDEDHKNFATFQASSLWTLCITFMYISLSMYFI